MMHRGTCDDFKMLSTADGDSKWLKSVWRERSGGEAIYGGERSTSESFIKVPTKYRAIALSLCQPSFHSSSRLFRHLALHKNPLR